MPQILVPAGAAIRFHAQEMVIDSTNGDLDAIAQHRTELNKSSMEMQTWQELLAFGSTTGAAGHSHHLPWRDARGLRAAVQGLAASEVWFMLCLGAPTWAAASTAGCFVWSAMSGQLNPGAAPPQNTWCAMHAGSDGWLALAC